MISIEYIDGLRSAEIDRVADHFPVGARVLEIGAGTGVQAARLASRGLNVRAIDLAETLYAADRVFPIVDYDGRHIPFPDASFDVVYSSNVLEHVPDLTQMHAEIRRVLRYGGIAIHVLPTHWWRAWTTVSAFPVGFSEARRRVKSGQAPVRVARALAAPLRQPRHGERGCGVITEAWFFRPAWWRKNFAANGFAVVTDEAMGLFYTGNMVKGQRWSIRRRERLAARLGSACWLFVLTTTSPSEPSSAS
jgi:SAM-dependent methyltransferase